MINTKTFKNTKELNEYVAQNGVRVISIETQVERYDTGLPLPRDGNFYTDREVIKVWFEEPNNIMSEQKEKTIKEELERIMSALEKIYAGKNPMITIYGDESWSIEIDYHQGGRLGGEATGGSMEELEKFIAKHLNNLIK
jgi:hypothetical protein